MEYTNEYINQIIEEEIVFSNSLTNAYNYPDNICHLLYIIVPAFILKYGIKNRNLIRNCFTNVPIIINDKQDKVYQAYYFSKPVYKDNNYYISKGIVLSNYKDISLMQLIDNLVHEYNHAVNSMNNDILVTDKEIIIRNGLVYNYFNKSNLNFINKNNLTMLEEVVNTKNTEMIIDIINNFSNYNISNLVVENTLYSIKHSIDYNYKSNSYYIESEICKRLLQNKTFISTIEALRFNGEIDGIEDFFDNIVGVNGTFNKLCNYLNKSMELQEKLTKTKFFKKRIINKIISVNKDALSIIKIFDNNTIYK